MFKKIAAAAALAFVASSAFAAPAAIYGGLDVGSTKADGQGDSKTSYGGFIGYGFHPNFAVELGYRELGKWDFAGADVKLKQTHLSVIGSYPLNRQLDIYGRLGYNKLSLDASSGNVTVGEDTTGALYGIGLNYSFAPNISARIEAQKPSSESTSVGVGIVFKF
jgi:OOP family OmpA-OmpF porin